MGEEKKENSIEHEESVAEEEEFVRKCWCEYAQVSSSYQTKDEFFVMDHWIIYNRGDKGAHRKIVQEVPFLFCPSCGKEVVEICPCCKQRIHNI